MRSAPAFDNATHRLSTKGLPILDGVIAWIDCDLHAIHDADDHLIVLGEVKELKVETPSGPLLFFQGGYGQFSELGQAPADIRSIASASASSRVASST